METDRYPHSGNRTAGQPGGSLAAESGQLSGLLGEHPGREWISWTSLVEEIDPLACIEASSGEPDLHYWEHPESSLAIAAGGCVTRLQATGADRFNQIAEQSRRLADSHLRISDIPHSLAGAILMGGYSFSDHNVEKEWKPFGAARFTLPRWTLIRSGKLHLLTLSAVRNGRTDEQVEQELLEEAERFAALCSRIREADTPPADNRRNGRGEEPYSDTLTQHPGGSREEWNRQVETARRMIRNGTYRKIVLARQVDVTAPGPIDIAGALYHFRHRFPGCYNFMVRTGGSAFMGASPERLVSLNSRRILTEGLAGSTARGESAVEDLTLGRKLMASSKERSEHGFVVEEIENNLRHWSRQVDYPEEPVLKKFNNVQHLYTPITAEADRDITIHQLAGSLHPTPAVGGFPRETAVHHISSIEKVDRGWYAGPVGWFTLSGNGEFAVAIRSALIHGDRARLYAGSGIVLDSDPGQEWQETDIKLRPMMDAIKTAVHHG